jgi:hypothetical protein
MAISGILTSQNHYNRRASGFWPTIATPAPPSGPTVIGQAFGGGFYAGQIGVSGVATHYLIVGPVASAQAFNLKWKDSNTATPGASSNIDGPQNTADMVAHGSSTVYPAAHFCNDLSTGGQTDWYMPAKNELEVCYFNLKPTTGSNVTSSGINPNAVPARASNYTSGNPAQTSAAIFQDGGAEAFSTANYGYWSSTARGDPDANFQYITTGYQSWVGKALGGTFFLRVRAVRRVAV